MAQQTQKRGLLSLTNCT